jgi:DNA-binding XRE family transcriptional regulator
LLIENSIMTGFELKAARRKLGWTQVTAAQRVGVSQAYLSMLEKEVRPVPRKLQPRLVSALELSPVALPFRGERRCWLREDELARELGALGYSGFRHVRAPKARWNPADLLLAALLMPDADSRLTEALPWLAWCFHDLDWKRVVSKAKLLDLQNRLGFVVTLGRQLAERKADQEAVRKLQSVEDALRGSVLAKADTLCHAGLTNAERRWLETERPEEAKQWNVLSDLNVDHLSHVA